MTERYHMNTNGWQYEAERERREWAAKLGDAARGLKWDDSEKRGAGKGFTSRLHDGVVEANEAPSVREPRRRGRKKQPKLNLSPEAQAQRQYDIAVEEVVNDELREDRVSLNRMVHDAKDFNGVSVDEDGRDGG